MKTIAVWFSNGAASAVAAKKTIERYGDTHMIRILNNPVVEEHEDNLRFKQDVEKWLGLPIEDVINPAYPDCSAEEIWDSRRYMCGVHGAPCTLLLKKDARKKWEARNKFDHLVLGFTFEEQKRWYRFRRDNPNVLPGLIGLGIRKFECFDILEKNRVARPRIYDLGFPNANCIGCVKATSPAYWDLVRKTFPKVFERRVEQSEELGAKLVTHKGKRIPLKMLPTKINEQIGDDMSFECSSFCFKD